jgi:hypothetical protein
MAENLLNQCRSTVTDAILRAGSRHSWQQTWEPYFNFAAAPCAAVANHRCQAANSLLDDSHMHCMRVKSAAFTQWLPPHAPLCLSNSERFFKAPNTAAVGD